VNHSIRSHQLGLVFMYACMIIKLECWVQAGKNISSPCSDTVRCGVVAVISDEQCKDRDIIVNLAFEIPLRDPMDDLPLMLHDQSCRRRKEIEG
jgi:hypothetical protein